MSQRRNIAPLGKRLETQSSGNNNFDEVQSPRHYTLCQYEEINPDLYINESFKSLTSSEYSQQILSPNILSQ